MVASDGSRGTLREPDHPSEGWQTAMSRSTRRNEKIQEKIAKLVDQAFREANYPRNVMPEVAPRVPVPENSTRSQTTGNLKEDEPVSETRQKKKRWRRLRSWRAISNFPTRQERELLNRNVNTMSKWDFERAIAEFERNEQKLEEIFEEIQETVNNAKEQAEKAELYLKIQEKIRKKLFKEDMKRLPSHYHSAATCVYTNHSARQNLFYEYLGRQRGRSAENYRAQLDAL